MDASISSRPARRRGRAPHTLGCLAVATAAAAGASAGASLKRSGARALAGGASAGASLKRSGARALVGGACGRRPSAPAPRAAGSARAAAPAVVSATARSWGLPASFVSVAVVNRVSNRVLLVPLARHTYFLALASGVVQLAFYGAWLAWSRRRGLVTGAMQRFVRTRLWLLASFGALEGAFFPLVFYAAAHLPGALVQVLNQTLIPCTVLFSALLLRRSYDWLQLAGVGLVLAGVLLFALHPHAIHPAAMHPQAVYVILCVAAYALMALAMVVKEVVFLQYRAWLRERAPPEGEPAEEGHPPLDTSLFLAVSTLARAAVLLLGWPLYLFVDSGLSLAQSASAGTSALLAPGVLRLAALYWACNAGVSITAILMVRRTSAAATVLANVVALPLSALLFCCRLPMLPPQAFQWTFVSSLCFVVLGNLLYSHDVLRRKP